MPLNSLSSKSEKKSRGVQDVASWMIPFASRYIFCQSSSWWVSSALQNPQLLHYKILINSLMSKSDTFIKFKVFLMLAAVLSGNYKLSVNETLKTISYGWVMHNENLFFYQFCLFFRNGKTIESFNARGLNWSNLIVNNAKNVELDLFF